MAAGHGDAKIIQAYQEHRPYLTDLAFRMLGDIGAAEDAVQDAFTTVNPDRARHRRPRRRRRVLTGALPDARAEWSTAMTAEATQHIGQVRPPEPVAPAGFVRAVIRPMTKVLNPLIVRLAGRRHFAMAAQIEHVGRRSGKVYVTPATAHVHGDEIVIALTFGNQSDWTRNVRAAGGCLIRYDGRTYRATDPRFLNRQDAGPQLKGAFSPLLRAGTRTLGVRQFLVLRAEDLGPSPRPGAVSRP